MSDTPLMDIAEIKQWLPHRYPFLLVDRVMEFREGNYIRGYKNITVNEAVFNGHFPRGPIFPGVMIIEAMAQVSGILGFKTLDKKPEDGFVYLLVGIDKARFRQQVVPGDRLDLEATVAARKQDIWRFECVASVDGQEVASATILCAQKEV